MLSRRAVPFTLASLLATAAGRVHAAPAVWVCHEVPPYLTRGARGYEGYAYELFQRVTHQAGLEVDLQYLPWARALRMLQARLAQAAVVITRSPERETQFRWLYPVGRFRFAVFTRMASPAPASVDIAALKSMRVGSLRASVSRGMLEAAGAPQVVEGKDYPELLTLLNRGLVDAVIGPETVLRSLDAKTGEGLRVTLSDQGYDFYAAAGPSMPDETVLQIRKAYQQLVDSGAVAALKRKHPGLFPDE